MIFASVVTYNSNKVELETVVNCVAQDSVDRIFIVDNSPTDVLREFVIALTPKVTYIFGHGNVGYGTGHNIAIRKSISEGAKYHIVINPDIRFGKGVIEKLSSYMDENPDVGQVMPRVVDPDGRLQYLCKLLPTPLDLIARRFIPIKSYQNRQNYHFEMQASGYNQIMEVPFLSGCFMMFRVDALDQVNGFSPHFWMYCEDIDICRKIGENYRTIYYPFCTIVHVHQKESFKSRKMLFAHIKSAIKYFNKWGWIVDQQRSKINKKAKAQYLPKQ